MNIESITLHIAGHKCTNEGTVTTATVNWTRTKDPRGGEHTSIEVNCDDCGWELEPSDEIEDMIDSFLDNVADSIEDAFAEMGTSATCRDMSSDDDVAMDEGQPV